MIRSLFAAIVVVLFLAAIAGAQMPPMFGSGGIPTVRDGCLCKAFDAVPGPEADAIIAHSVTIFARDPGDPDYTFRDVLVKPGATLEIAPGGKLRLRTLRLAPGSRLIQRGGTIIFRADLPYNLAVEDPYQFGRGLVATDASVIVASPSTPRRPFVSLTHGIVSGQTVLTCLEPPEGWAVGDLLTVGDTGQYDRNSSRNKYVQRAERVTITAINGATITTTPFVHPHVGTPIPGGATFRGIRSGPGRMDQANVWPHVGNLTRSAKWVGEEEGDFTDAAVRRRRPHVFLTGVGEYRIDDLEGVRLGRTTAFIRQENYAVTAIQDNLNPHGRYALHFHGVSGRLESEGRFCVPTATNFALRDSGKHGIVIHHTSYGKFTHFVLDRVEGAGWFVEGGTERDNDITDWLVIAATGDGFAYRNPPNDDPWIVSLTLRAGSKSHGTRGGAGGTDTSGRNNIARGVVVGTGHTGSQTDSHSGVVWYLGAWGDVPPDVKAVIMQPTTPGGPMMELVDPRIAGHGTARPPEDIVVVNCPMALSLWGVGTGERHPDKNNNLTIIPYPEQYTLRNLMAVNARENSIGLQGVRNVVLENVTAITTSGKLAGMVSGFVGHSHGYTVDTTIRRLFLQGTHNIDYICMSLTVEDSSIASVSAAPNSGLAQSDPLRDRRIRYLRCDIGSMSFASIYAGPVTLAQATAPFPAGARVSAKHLWDCRLTQSRVGLLPPGDWRFWAHAQGPASYAIIDSGDRWGFPETPTVPQGQMVFAPWTGLRTDRSPNYGEMGPAWDGKERKVTGGYLYPLVDPEAERLARLAAAEAELRRLGAVLSQAVGKLGAETEARDAQADVVAAEQAKLADSEARLAAATSDASAAAAAVEAQRRVVESIKAETP